MLQIAMTAKTGAEKAPAGIHGLRQVTISSRENAKGIK